MNIEIIARKFFSGARASHDWDHTLRVRRMCGHIGRVEHADMDVLHVAAFLHDIGRARQDASSGAVCHAALGAQMAAPVIEELPLTTEQKHNVLHSIRSHRFRGGDAPETLEAKVLFDADKLDAIGAVGIARAYLFAGEIGARLHTDTPAEKSRPYSSDDTGYREFQVKLRNIHKRMLTAEGKRLAAARHQFTEYFFEQFLYEYQGDR